MGQFYKGGEPLGGFSRRVEASLGRKRWKNILGESEEEMVSCRKHAKQLREDKVLGDVISSLPCLFSVGLKKHIKVEKVSQKLLHLQISTSKPS